MNSKNIFSFAVLIMLSFGVASFSNANAATVVGPFSAHPPILKNINATNATAQSNATNATAQSNAIPTISTQNATNSSNVVLIAPGTGAAGPNGTCVTQNNCFNPHTINITTGQNVTWNNTDSVLHTVVSGKPTDSNSTIGKLFNKSIPPGETISIKFNSTGKINYFCQIHPWMKGEVVVKNSTSTLQSSGTNSQQNTTGSETNSSKNIINSLQNVTNSSSQNSSNSQAGTLVTNSSNQTHS